MKHITIYSDLYFRTSSDSLRSSDAVHSQNTGIYTTLVTSSGVVKVESPVSRASRKRLGSVLERREPPAAPS